ncbi:hypothetical protein ACTHOQ_05485 [Solibacillus silvestris]|uniref:hypothetical protein n=1 Tax=Solibacillus silvestris TaxID=76853 RepID=UPI003F7D6AA3
MQSNTTHRWFLGISPFHKMPHHSIVTRFLWEGLQGNAFHLVKRLVNDPLFRLDCGFPVSDSIVIGSVLFTDDSRD